MGDDNTVTEKKRNFYLVYHVIKNGFGERNEVFLLAKEEKDATKEAKEKLKKVEEKFKKVEWGMLDDSYNPFIYSKEEIVKKYCIDLMGKKYKTLKNAKLGEFFFDGDNVQRMVTKKHGITTHTMGNGLCTKITSKKALLEYSGM